MTRLVLILLLLLPACSPTFAKYLPERPSRNFVPDLEGEASPEFIQGWKDGCESGMASGSNSFYKMYYRLNKVDGFKMTSSGDYNTAWNNAFWYCIRYDAIKHASPIWSSTFGGMK